MQYQFTCQQQADLKVLMSISFWANRCSEKTTEVLLHLLSDNSAMSTCVGRPEELSLYCGVTSKQVVLSCW